MSESEAEWAFEQFTLAVYCHFRHLSFPSIPFCTKILRDSFPRVLKSWTCFLQDFQQGPPLLF